MENQTSFVLRSEAEIRQFDRRLADYMNATVGSAIVPFPLFALFRQYQELHNGRRLFIAVFDIVVSFVHLRCDMVAIYGTWNDLFSKGKLEGGSVLECPERFTGKAEIHRFATSYVLRYRALCDKIMGFLVLRFAQCEYDAFVGARSRKNRFSRIAAQTPAIPSHLADMINGIAKQIDDSFRTAEAHGTGVLRKGLFLMDEIENEVNPLLPLAGLWNALSGVFQELTLLLAGNGDLRYDG